MGDVLFTLFFIAVMTLTVIWAVNYTIKTMKKRKTMRGEMKNKFDEGILFVENSLSQSGFTISRRVGHYYEDKHCAGASFFLYVDDVNKKWVMTSPIDSHIDKIRGFEDLIAFDFFDEDVHLSKPVKALEAYVKGSMAVLGAGAGLITGAMLGGGKGALLGATGGGVGFSKMMGLLTGGSGVSGTYGLILKTTDTTVNQPAFLFDFLQTYGKIKMFYIGKTISKNYPTSIARADVIYKKDLETIAEMQGVLEYIYESS